MRDNKSTKWATGLKFVQLQKNHSLHTGNKCSPYKATFGINTPLGLQSTIIPAEKWNTLKTAKELFEAVGIDYDSSIDDSNEDGDYTAITREEIQPSIEATQPAIEQPYDEVADLLIGVRNTVRVAQKSQAERMATRSKKFLPEVIVGDFVILPVPEVDRGPSDPPNLICRVVDIDYTTMMHELACQAGVLKNMWARNSFDKMNGEIIDIRTDVSATVREAVTNLSVGGGQGMLKCNCTGACANNRCSCRKNSLQCNSRCHGGNNNCKNK